MVFFKRGHTRAQADNPPPSADVGPPLTLDVLQDVHTFDGDDGHSYWLSGYTPVHRDPDGGYHFAHLGETLADGRLLYCRVAGANYRAAALQGPRFNPGSPLTLRPEPENPHDPDAVAVWDGKGSTQLGYLPADCCRAIAARMRSGEQLAGVALREIRRGSKSGPRCALHVLVMPIGTLQLSIVDDDER